jgi:hypothetical protein
MLVASKLEEAIRQQNASFSGRVGSRNSKYDPVFLRIEVPFQLLLGERFPVLCEPPLMQGLHAVEDAVLCDLVENNQVFFDKAGLIAIKLATYPRQGKEVDLIKVSLASAEQYIAFDTSG